MLSIQIGEQDSRELQERLADVVKEIEGEPETVTAKKGLSRGVKAN
jgi:hypothetical protein